MWDGDLSFIKSFIEISIFVLTELKNSKHSRLPGATELNVCHSNHQNKPPLRLLDDQISNTIQNGEEYDFSNQVNFYCTSLMCLFDV